MWKLKVSEGENEAWVTSVNNHIGRMFWEFDPDAGTPDERAQVDQLRNHFTSNRFRCKQSSDLMMRLQVYSLLYLNSFR